MSDNIREDERIDSLQRDGLRIIQNTALFCFGMDAVLLSGFVTAKKHDRVIDLCTGNGVIPILLSAKTEARDITGIEIQEESAELARRSVLMNGLSGIINIVTGDIKDTADIFGRASFDVVTVNPPYMNENHGLISLSSPKAIARHELLCTLSDVIEASAALLKESGSFYMVHRPHRMADIIDLLRKNRLEPKRLRLVYPYADREPNMLLVEASKGGNPFLRVEPPLIIFEKEGVYTREVSDLYGSEEE